MSTMTKRARLDAETIEYRKHIFEIAAELVEETGVSDVDEVDPGEVARRYREATGDSSSRTRPARVGRLLADPARFSPFVDEVAVERALDFDWGAIERLSDVEWWEVVDRLAAMRDPWDLEESRVPLYAEASALGIAGDRNGGMADLYPARNEAVELVTSRRSRLLEGPEPLRSRLQAAVALARQEREAAA